MARRKKNLKLPNGFGSISYIGDGRRKPWRVRKTANWELTDAATGKPVTSAELSPEAIRNGVIEKQRYINIGTFETYEEAFLALSNYNRNPYDVDADTLTLQDVMDQWEETELKKFAPSTQKRHLRFMKRVPEDLRRKRIKEIKVIEIEAALRSVKTTERVVADILTTLRHVLDHAVKHDYCSKNYARMIDPRALASVSSTKRPHKPFTPEEIEMALSMDGDVAEVVRTALYTGMRPEELLSLKTDHVHLSEGYIQHGIKTEAGKDRIIPIHRAIADLVRRKVSESKSGYIFELTWGGHPRRYAYQTFGPKFKKVFPGHTPHDTRHTFITQWRHHLQLDDAICHLIVGHESKDISEDVYTHRPVEALKREMEKFFYGSAEPALFKQA